ncbi:hypothetical protein [Pseudoalteromonas sp. R3]|uniref:hypothetical protein n=1 Tax=Pseudoalteromonas sp. R3 TaxID=1709477 RepID=UPI0006B65C00|nr:hypothetical protein [Pseudoalteromonas sp. R3]AZZ98485.1 hypothetical protein ELR70_16025 [Pseudoalteromonas sp. R3]
MFSVLTLRLEHDYFADKQWRNAELEATEATQSWLQRYQLTLHHNGACWQLYATQGSSKQALLHYLLQSQGLQTLEFWLLQPQSDFVTFTDLPMDWQGQLAFNSAYCKKSTEGSLELTAKNVSQCAFKAQAIAKITFNLSDLLASDHYRISMRARTTQWVYHLIQRGQTRLHKPQLRDKKNQIMFTTPMHYRNEEGENTWLSDSGEVDLPMQQVPVPRFELVDTQTLDSKSERSISRTVISALPTPRSDQIYLEQEGSLRRVQSHIYVYF